jgi:glycosyltransferase involved in cell wall biosynthesis
LNKYILKINTKVLTKASKRMSPVHICLSLGRVRSLDEGLGEFALRLGHALLNCISSLALEQHIKLHFHARRKLHGCFGKHFVYHDASRLHRLYHPSRTQFSVWHCLHQLNTMLPAGNPKSVLLTVHDLNFLYLDSALQIKKRISKTQRIFKRVNHIVAISNHTKTDLIKTFPQLYCPIEVISNGVTDLTSHQKDSIAKLIDVPYLFHISRLAPSKNVESILNVASIWPEQRFVIAGPSGQDFDRIQLIAQNKQLQNVDLLPNVSNAQKAWLYENCIGFMFPSIAEGFGLPPVEAMYFGKPVFASNNTALPEVCGSCALYFDSFEPDKMRSLVQSGINAQDRQRSAFYIRQHAHQYTWNKAARAYLQLYLRLAGVTTPSNL